MRRLSGTSGIITGLNFSRTNSLHGILLTVRYPHIRLVNVHLHGQRGRAINLLVLLLTSDNGPNSLRGLHPSHVTFLRTMSNTTTIDVRDRHLRTGRGRLLSTFVRLLTNTVSTGDPCANNRYRHIPTLALVLTRTTTTDRTPTFDNCQPARSR